MLKMDLFRCSIITLIQCIYLIHNFMWSFLSCQTFLLCLAENWKQAHGQSMYPGAISMDLTCVKLLLVYHMIIYSTAN